MNGGCTADVGPLSNAACVASPVNTYGEIIRMISDGEASVLFSNLANHYAVRLRFSIVYTSAYQSGSYSGFQYGLDDNMFDYVPTRSSIINSASGNIITTGKINH